MCPCPQGHQDRLLGGSARQARGADGQGSWGPGLLPQGGPAKLSPVTCLCGQACRPWCLSSPGQGAKEGGGRSAPGLLPPLPRVPPAEQGQCVALSLAGPPGPRSLGNFSIFPVSQRREGRVCPMVSGVWRPAASSEALETHPPDARSPCRWGPETGRPWGIRGTRPGCRPRDPRP